MKTANANFLRIFYFVLIVLGIVNSQFSENMDGSRGTKCGLTEVLNLVSVSISGEVLGLDVFLKMK